MESLYISEIRIFLIFPMLVSLSLNSYIFVTFILSFLFYYKFHVGGIIKWKKLEQLFSSIVSTFKNNLWVFVKLIVFFII